MTDARVSSLLRRWQAAYAQGRDIPTEELCRDCPALAPLVAGKLDVLREVNRLTPYNAAAGRFEGPKEQFTWKNTGLEQGDDHPVVNVSWEDAMAFCIWLSQQEGRQYRLPTEAEWEYAARGRSGSRYWCGDDPAALATAGNVLDRTARARFADLVGGIATADGHDFTAPVGKFRANPFDLHDTIGNVREWCFDWYGPYTGPHAVDPVQRQPVENARRRVVRGGGWNSRPEACRSADRDHAAPDERMHTLGFRVVLVAPPGLRAP